MSLMLYFFCLDQAALSCSLHPLRLIYTISIMKVQRGDFVFLFMSPKLKTDLATSKVVNFLRIAQLFKINKYNIVQYDAFMYFPFM